MHSSYALCQPGTPLPPILPSVIDSHMKESFSLFCSPNVSWFSRLPEHPIVKNRSRKKKSLSVLFISMPSDFWFARKVRTTCFSTNCLQEFFLQFKLWTQPFHKSESEGFEHNPLYNFVGTHFDTGDYSQIWYRSFAIFSP